MTLRDLAHDPPPAGTPFLGIGVQGGDGHLILPRRAVFECVLTDEGRLRFLTPTPWYYPERTVTYWVPHPLEETESSDEQA